MSLQMNLLGLATVHQGHNLIVEMHRIIATSGSDCKLLTLNLIQSMIRCNFLMNHCLQWKQSTLALTYRSIIGRNCGQCGWTSTAGTRWLSMFSQFQGNKRISSMAFATRRRMSIISGNYSDLQDDMNRLKRKERACLKTSRLLTCCIYLIIPIAYYIIQRPV